MQNMCENVFHQTSPIKKNAVRQTELYIWGFQKKNMTAIVMVMMVHVAHSEVM